MAADAQSTLRAADLLLKQGKIDVAIGKLDTLARGAARDLLVLNRIGDLLARYGRSREAIGYYLRIAGLFSEQGFYPKAVAIHKKVLRLDQDNTECLTQLGELYVSQKLPGEARGYFLRAAECHLAAQDFARARELYKRLTEVEPDDPRHVARLAEALAAQGETELAGEELLRLAARLRSARQLDDAEQTYVRARELVPERSEALLGLARCRVEAGKSDEAIAMLEQASAAGDAEPSIVGALALAYERAGRRSDAFGLLSRPGAEEVPPQALRELFSHALGSAAIDELWSDFDGVLKRWLAGDAKPRAFAVLGELAELEPHGHLPALRRLYDGLKGGGDRNAEVKALEELIRAHQARSEDEEAFELLAELEQIAPSSPLVAGAETSEPPPPETSTAAEVTADVDVGSGDVPLEAEAPAVPLNRSDEEFVTGRLTQAEILEKYGLLSQALDQVREVTAKFPGYEPAQERLVALLRESPEREGLRDAQVALALARRASGDSDGANAAAREARQTARLTPEQEGLLQRLGLSEARRAAASGAARAASPETDTEEAGAIEAPRVEAPPEPEVAAVDDGSPASNVVPAADESPEPASTRSAPGVVLIDFDDIADGPDGDAEVERGADQPLAAQPPETPDAPVAVEEPAEPPAAAQASADPFEDDDDLSTITAALESELFADEDEARPTGPEAEQSMGEVFAAFKQHVEREVASDDYRTHYDLGIAYKEMGLIDEAIAEFETAIRSSELFREACSMLALCHREREEVQEAADWYRQALDAAGSDERELTGLRYDLAEVLMLAGERDEALSLFRNVLKADPSFREVRERIAALESSTTA